MTDATFYTAYDDMPPAVVRLRRRRRPRRGYGGLSLVWLTAVGVTALSAVPALGPGSRPQVAAHVSPAMRAAAALPAPRHLIAAPWLQPTAMSGLPAGFGAAPPLPGRLVRSDAPTIVATAEPPAPLPDPDRLAAGAYEAVAPGPQVAVAVADAEDVDAALPALPPSSLLAADVPLPTPRPSDLAPTPARPAPVPQATRRPVVAAATAPAVTADNRSFLEKFFSLGQPAGKPATPALGYAAPESGFVSALLGAGRNPARSYGDGTAIYEIASHTVFMPDGTRLEAHSGLGDRLDNPRFVHERMRGPTPPATYALTLRESLFHGVQALRLTPMGSSVFGRVGLLAHTYMLGPNGDSNGCVSFRNYRAFLQAFQNGDVKRLVVVARLS